MVIIACIQVVTEEFAAPDSETFSFRTGELVPGLYFLQTDMNDIPAYRIVIINQGD